MGTEKFHRAIACPQSKLVSRHLRGEKEGRLFFTYRFRPSNQQQHRKAYKASRLRLSSHVHLVLQFAFSRWIGTAKAVLPFNFPAAPPPAERWSLPAAAHLPPPLMSSMMAVASPTLRCGRHMVRNATPLSTSVIGLEHRFNLLIPCFWS